MDLLRTKPSPAMVVSLVALSISLGGTAYAAVRVTGKNVKDSSLTGRDLKNDSIDNRDVKNLLRADFAAGQAPQDGAPGAHGAKGDKGDKGDRGAQGAPGPFPDALQSGKTLRGNFATRGQNPSTTPGALANVNDSISFGFTLPSAPVTHYLTTGAAPIWECPGTASAPTAASGHLCVYETTATGAAAGVFNPIDGAPGSNRFGAGVYAVGANDTFAAGTWAVTAP